MRAMPIAIFALMGFSGPAPAVDTGDQTNYCASHRHEAMSPQSGSAGFLFDTSAWSEAGVCLKFPMDRLSKAATNIDVMTWAGVTRIVRVQPLPLAPNQIMHVRIDYEARHQHFFVCQTAQWPIEWSETLVHESGSSRNRADIAADRVPGGNSNGGYIKRWSVRAEMRPVSANETSFHMRYEIAAPGQQADWAVGAIIGYVDRLRSVARGDKAPGPMIDPDCPY